MFAISRRDSELLQQILHVRPERTVALIQWGWIVCASGWDRTDRASKQRLDDMLTQRDQCCVANAP